MIRFDPERVQANVRSAATEDLLDRATVYRSGMEPEALEIIEDELEARGVGPDEVAAHAARREREVAFLPDGTARRCSFCHQPAVAEGWGWHRMWGLLPVFPRFFYYCETHRPAGHPEAKAAGAEGEPPSA
jgi:hypothetical protein